MQHLNRHYNGRNRRQHDFNVPTVDLTDETLISSHVIGLPRLPQSNCMLFVFLVYCILGKIFFLFYGYVIV